MPIRKNKLELSPAQMEFYTAPENFVLFSGGLGSGKTYSGAVWAAMMALKHKRCKGLITANSYKQLNKATLSTLFNILDMLNIQYDYKKQQGELIINGAVIDCVSMENYNDLRGPEYGWAWSDECAFYKEEAFNVLIGRLRDKRGPCQWKGTTTPNGFNFLYEAFVERGFDSQRVVRARTADNRANLPDSYFGVLQKQYGSRLARQELDGEFVNLNSGNVYYAFDRYLHVKECAIPEDVKEIYVGLDFNVHPLCGVFSYHRDGVTYIFDELYLENSNTFEAAKQIISRYPFHKIRVVADDSGSRRKTSAQKTDHEILRRAGLEVVKFKNPEIKDRYNNMNRVLDHGKFIVDPGCKKLIEDFEKLIYDNKNPMLSHVSDAAGYVEWHLDPFKKPKRKAKIRYM